MESSNGMSQGSDTSSQPGGVTPSAQPAQSAPASMPDERIFRQSEVNEIVKKAKYGALEDYKRMQAEQPQYAAQKFGDTSHTPSQYQQTQGSPLNEDHLRKIAAEEAQRLRDQWTQDERSRAEAKSAQDIVQNFYNKIAPGKDKYQDFDQVVGDIEYARFPNVVQLLAQYVENSHDVLYELGKDRIKMANLEQLSMMSPKDAIKQAQRLSESLKANETASKYRTPNEPLSQLRPSNTGTDNGALSVKDYRSKYRV